VARAGSDEEARFRLLLDWILEESKTQNLTAILDEGDMEIDHLQDSLALAAVAAKAGVPLEGGVLCVDIGTGAGFPGIPLAIAHPGSRWVLVESEGQKVKWLGKITGRLGLGNAEIFQGRGRELRHVRKDLDGTVGVVTARAVGDLGKLCREARGLLRPGGVLLCPKGRNLEPAELALGEREARKSGLVPAGVLPMEVPGRERVCVVYSRSSSRSIPTPAPSSDTVKR
jgi:16S rRNA (guanine527-N7)-methyltransferase